MRALRFPAAIREADPGLLATLGAALIWGTLPLYWYLLRDISPFLILAHRIIWSCVFLFPLVLITRRTGEVLNAAKNAGTLRGLLYSSIVLGCNWLVFIWAVLNGKVLETSLGYYISPLLTICLGVAVFRDRPGRVRGIAIAIAGAGVTAEIIINGTVPWAGLGVGVLFSIYALLRKLAPVESLPGLALETLILFPFALIYILWSGSAGTETAWGADRRELLLLMGSGVITSTPLVLYAYGARHLTFTTVGVLQYLAPTMSFLIGIFVFDEPFTPGRAVSFSAIWAALVLYTLDSIRNHALRTRAAREKSVNAASSGREDAAWNREK